MNQNKKFQDEINSCKTNINVISQTFTQITQKLQTASSQNQQSQQLAMIENMTSKHGMRNMVNQEINGQAFAAMNSYGSGRQSISYISDEPITDSRTLYLAILTLSTYLISLSALSNQYLNQANLILGTSSFAQNVTLIGELGGGGLEEQFIETNIIETNIIGQNMGMQPMGMQPMGIQPMGIQPMGIGAPIVMQPQQPTTPHHSKQIHQTPPPQLNQSLHGYYNEYQNLLSQTQQLQQQSFQILTLINNVSKQTNMALSGGSIRKSSIKNKKNIKNKDNKSKSKKQTKKTK